MALLDEPFTGRLAGNPLVRGNVSETRSDPVIAYTYRIGNSNFAVLFECLVRRGRIVREVVTYATPCCGKGPVEGRQGIRCMKCKKLIPLRLASAMPTKPAALQKAVEEWVELATPDPLSAALELAAVLEELERFMVACRATLPLSEEE